MLARCYDLGSWRGEGETKGGPFGPAGKLSSTSTCEWFAGGFRLVCRGEETGPTGKRAGASIVGNKRAFVSGGANLPSQAPCWTPGSDLVQPQRPAD